VPARMTQSGDDRENLDQLGLGLGSMQIAASAFVIARDGKDGRLKRFQLFDARCGGRTAKCDRGFAQAAKTVWMERESSARVTRCPKIRSWCRPSWRGYWYIALWI